MPEVLSSMPWNTDGIAKDESERRSCSRLQLLSDSSEDERAKVDCRPLPSDSEDERKQVSQRPLPSDSEDERRKVFRERCMMKDLAKGPATSEDERVAEACRQLANRYAGSSEYWTSESERADSERAAESSSYESQSSQQEDDIVRTPSRRSLMSQRNRYLRKAGRGSGPPLTAINPGGYQAGYYDGYDFELNRLVPPVETLGTIMSQDALPAMPVMSSDEAEAPEELSDVEEPPEDFSDACDASTDDEHRNLRKSRTRGSRCFSPQKIPSAKLGQHNEGAPYGRSASNGSTSTGGSSGPGTPTNSATEATAEINRPSSPMSLEDVKAWEEKRKAMRAARRGGRTTYGDYLRAQYYPAEM